MANRYLIPLYKQLFDEDFSYTEFNKRLKMQKAVYLLQEMGAPVGDYRFSWYKHGPYSQSLLNDMYNASTVSQMDLSTIATDVEDSIKKLKHALVVPSGSSYSSAEWTECLGSIHYLRGNICSQSSDDATLLENIKLVKPHLSYDKDNAEALSRIKELYS